MKKKNTHEAGRISRTLAVWLAIGIAAAVLALSAVGTLVRAQRIQAQRVNAESVQ